jgi:hypothetical protein
MRRLAFLAVIYSVAFTQLGRAADKPKENEPKTTGKPLLLFNGKDLASWDYHLADKSVLMDQVWSVKDGVLRCTGKPAGYIFTKRNDFQNYVLDVEWRWPGKGGNNGVLVHVSKPEELGVWPKSLEVQLQSGEAGDFWIIGTKINVENEQARRTDRRYKNLTDGSEKKLGEWNAFRIICRGDEVIVYVNGDLVNHATNCSEHAGAIALQSEGTPIEYRKVELRKLAD